MTHRIAPKSGYLPSLDGWRAIAILAVLMIHDTSWHIGRFSDASFQHYGSYGVILFFAISGVLICGRILEEEALTGRFRIGDFYIRRFLRIQPAALVYLATIALLTLLGVLHEHWHYWLGALLLYANFLYRFSGPVALASFFTGHFWTLAVEEHFYLLISALLYFVRRRRIAIFIALFFLIKIAQKIGMHFLHTEPLLRRTYWQIHILLFPAIAALLLRVPAVRRAAERWLHPILVFVLTAFALYLGRRYANHNESALMYSFTFCVIATMLHPRSLTTRFLELAPMRLLGRLSYSIYLWHVLFFSLRDIGTTISSPTLRFLSAQPWRYVATLAAASVSYYFIEKPLIRLGHRLAPPATPGHADFANIPTLPEKPGRHTVAPTL